MEDTVIRPRLNEVRSYQLIKEALKKFDLDLSGLRVLTEAATGNYVLTPIVAALAGAEKVFALTRDSRYGDVKTVSETTLSLAKKWGVDQKIEILLSRTDERIGEADIVTNLGFVRPIDRELISRMKETAVIPLMFETWEFREEDIDLSECKRRGIPVLGTNEHVPELDTFGYIGPLAIKLAFELDIEVFHSNVMVVGGGIFGESTVHAFKQLGANVTNVQVTEDDRLDDDWVLDEIMKSDLLVFVEYVSRELLLGSHGQLSPEKLLQLNPGIAIVHIAGVVNGNEIERFQILHCPERIGDPGHMSVTTDYLGPKPLIDLHTAGLKVGEAMARARLNGLNSLETIRVALQSSPAQDFTLI